MQELIKSRCIARNHPMMGIAVFAWASRIRDHRDAGQAVFEATARVAERQKKPFPRYDPGNLCDTELNRSICIMIRFMPRFVLNSKIKEILTLIGKMIEIPGRPSTADKIAKSAQFFSFGTNDLTQMTFGFQPRPNIGSFLPDYLEKKRYCRWPVQQCLTVKRRAVLIKIAWKKAAAT